MRYAKAVSWMLGAAIVSAGCVQIDYGIQLEEDLSGTSDLEMTIDLDRVDPELLVAHEHFTRELEQDAFHRWYGHGGLRIRVATWDAAP